MVADSELLQKNDRNIPVIFIKKSFVLLNPLFLCRYYMCKKYFYCKDKTLIILWK